MGLGRGSAGLAQARLMEEVRALLASLHRRQGCNCCPGVGVTTPVSEGPRHTDRWTDRQTGGLQATVVHGSAHWSGAPEAKRPPVQPGGALTGQGSPPHLRLCKPHPPATALGGRAWGPQADSICFASRFFP